MPIINTIFGDKIQEIKGFSFSTKEKTVNNTLYNQNRKEALKKTNDRNQDSFEYSIDYKNRDYNSAQDINDIQTNRVKIELQKNKKNNIDKEKKDNSKKYSITKNKDDLSDSEKRLIAELERMDRAVKAHEAAHKAAGGGLVRGGATYSYVIGPDGKRYASSGEVKIDMSYNLSDPEATIQKMEQVKRAALAPIDPSAQDRAVAQRASAIESEARVEEQKQQEEKIASMMDSLHKSSSVQAYLQKNNTSQIINDYK
ncbi:MAG: hypothetical protein GXO79_04570 [Chlorobi bacterium]|nr:hypothetical protein [Chlorobiota bacterium]